MSCTIFYEGTLKKENNPNDVLNIISNHLRGINGELSQTGNPIIINFLNGQSEPLVFHFKKNKIDDFCKWSGENTEEFYKIFDMFVELKSLFKSLKIEDDEGRWHKYTAQKRPSKLKLRPLSSDEMKILERIRINENNPPNKIEKLITDKSGLQPFNKAILRIIVQDFIKIMSIESIDDFKPQVVFDFANELNFFADDYKNEIEFFDFGFCYTLVEIWISCAFTYKNKGIVKELAKNIRGLTTKKSAALYGILSIFLNCHSNGSINPKEAEMRKFAAKYYITLPFGEVMVVDKPERELEFFFSMMDFLGFSYTGVCAPGMCAEG